MKDFKAAAQEKVVKVLHKLTALSQNEAIPSNVRDAAARAERDIWAAVDQVQSQRVATGKRRV